MAALDMTSFDHGLKTYLTPQQVKNLAYPKNPFLALLPKMSTFGGRNLPIPIIYGIPAGRSATFAEAQAMKAPGLYQEFVLTRVHDYGLIEIDGETMLASESDKGAWFEARVVEYDGIVRAVANSLGSAIFRSGTGVIGARASISSNTVTLTNREDVVNFEIGQRIVASATDGGALRDTGDYAVVSSVDRSLGTVTAAVKPWSDITGFADADFLYVKGDAADTGANKKVAGLAGWIPSTAPGATAWFGVDRSVDPDRLGGIRLSATTMTMEESFIEAQARGEEAGAQPDTVVMNPLRAAELCKAATSRIVYDLVRSPDAPQIGFRLPKIATPFGELTIVPDRGCPKNVSYCLQMDTWKLYSLGEAPRMLNLDGLKWLRMTSSDSYESRCGYYAQLGCNGPGLNVRIAHA